MTSILPSKNEFLRAVRKGKIFPVYTEIAFEEPATVFEKIHAEGHSFLLESVKGIKKIGRYSFLGAEPYLIFRNKGRDTEIIWKGKRILTSSPPLKKLRELMNDYFLERVDGLPPFLCGAVGFIGYDFVHNFERLPQTALDDLNLPDAYFIFVDCIVAFDHYDKKGWIIASPLARKQEFNYDNITGIDWEEYYEESSIRIERLKEKVQGSKIQGSGVRGQGSEKIMNIEINYHMKKEQYMNIVRRTKEYIADGDIFQANLSQRLSAETGDTDAWSLYRILRSINPSPFAAFLDFGECTIVSSSPERLLKVEERTVETRPIAGTRPRGLDDNGDRRMRAELLMNEKERAEHIMLIDLERNDLGRVCDYGSIEVDELMITEDYSHVIHIVSNIKGRLAEGKDCFDVIRAAFPGGTITGVPKVRCMEIIDELEPVTRGPYTGSIGYISFTGDMDLNIIIRTFVIKDGVAYVHAGAGIVADSDPEREYYETLYKAEALIKTIEKVRIKE
ncbi:MAG: anthranilate synthase component I family protein [Nitrospirota bacterium]